MTKEGDCDPVYEPGYAPCRCMACGWGGIWHEGLFNLSLEMGRPGPSCPACGGRETLEPGFIFAAPAKVQ
jgi:hypothetical protein